MRYLIITTYKMLDFNQPVVFPLASCLPQPRPSHLSSAATTGVDGVLPLHRQTSCTAKSKVDEINQ
jgi:hypothetical protein